MATKKKKKISKIKSQVQDRMAITFKARSHERIPERIDIHNEGKFDHPCPNSADYDMIYLRGKK